MRQKEGQPPVPAPLQQTPGHRDGPRLVRVDDHPQFFHSCRFPPPANCPALPFCLIISGATGISYRWNSRYIRLGWIPVLFWYLPLR